MSFPHPHAESDESTARHDLRAYIHAYGRDLDLLFFKLPATQPKSSWNEPYSGQGVHLPSPRIGHHPENIIMGLENRPLHLRTDDGAWQPPYKNVAFRADAYWHCNALGAIATRLSTERGTARG